MAGKQEYTVVSELGNPDLGSPPSASEHAHGHALFLLHLHLNDEGH